MTAFADAMLSCAYVLQVGEHQAIEIAVQFASCIVFQQISDEAEQRYIANASGPIRGLTSPTFGCHGKVA